MPEAMNIMHVPVDPFHSLIKCSVRRFMPLLLYRASASSKVEA